MGELLVSRSRRLLRGLEAFVLADLITGMAAFSVIVLSSLWFFSIGWLTLTQEFANQGRVFGSPVQTDLAWLGVLVALPLVAPTLYLAARAYRLPFGLFRSALPSGERWAGLHTMAPRSIGSRLRAWRGFFHR